MLRWLGYYWQTRDWGEHGHVSEGSVRFWLSRLERR